MMSLRTRFHEYDIEDFSFIEVLVQRDKIRVRTNRHTATVDGYVRILGEKSKIM